MIFRIYFLFLLKFALYLTKTNAQIDKDCNNTKNCFAEVKSRLKFICERNNLRNWYFKNDQVCKSNAGIPDQYASEYELDESESDNGLYFVIKNLNPSGSSKLEYFSNKTKSEEKDCEIHIFTYGKYYKKILNYLKIKNNSIFL